LLVIFKSSALMQTSYEYCLLLASSIRTDNPQCALIIPVTSFDLLEAWSCFECLDTC
jgi:hypothetical protein